MWAVFLKRNVAHIGIFQLRIGFKMYLYTCQACLDENHVECERSTPAPNGTFGGRMCICMCHGRTNDQIKRDLEDHFKQIMELSNVMLDNKCVVKQPLLDNKCVVK